VRVVKPGGRVLMNVYGDPHKIEFFGFFVGAIQSVRPDFNGPPAMERWLAGQRAAKTALVLEARL